MIGSDDPQRPPTHDLDALTERVVDIWRSVLMQPAITADSHLMDVGANSLTAVKIRSRIRAELGRDVELIQLLEHPTPRELAPVVAVADRWVSPEPWHQLDWSDSDAE
jgi:aryl carrier-like protein